MEAVEDGTDRIDAIQFWDAIQSLEDVPGIRDTGENRFQNPYLFDIPLDTATLVLYNGTGQFRIVHDPLVRLHDGDINLLARIRPENIEMFLLSLADQKSIDTHSGITLSDDLTEAREIYAMALSSRVYDIKEMRKAGHLGKPQNSGEVVTNPIFLDLYQQDRTSLIRHATDISRRLNNQPGMSISGELDVHKPCLQTVMLEPLKNGAGIYLGKDMDLPVYIRPTPK